MDNEHVRQWLVSYIAENIGVPAAQVPHDEPFDSLGVDSLLAVTITVEIRRIHGVKLKATAIYDYNTVSALTAHIGEKLLAKA